MIRRRIGKMIHFFFCDNDYAYLKLTCNKWKNMQRNK